ncbi:hypothetical protein AK812_SmicGene7849 [Symbiodinium microadriaticum]|uniref:Uncharacterized protein n=1 Tax=Symbiodinium microadriaticum TaxID=2951 RepID=A0A1Q9EMG7_SYMMI|nr:hypothetical protein AK812_SmicGene7849 [Symbiodinium microadriaticum]
MALFPDRQAEVKLISELPRSPKLSRQPFLHGQERRLRASYSGNQEELIELQREPRWWQASLCLQRKEGQSVVPSRLRAAVQ